MVVIVSIICAAGFVGVLPIVLGLVVFGGGGSGSQTQQVLKDAENRVKATPDSIDALVALAALYRGANRTQDEAVTLQKAIGVGAKNNDELQLLLGGLSQQVGQRLQVLQTYTKAHPKDADAFLTYGQTAETANQTTVGAIGLSAGTAARTQGIDAAPERHRPRWIDSKPRRRRRPQPRPRRPQPLRSPRDHPLPRSGSRNRPVVTSRAAGR